MRDAPSCGTVDGMRRGGDRAGSNLAGQPWSNWPSLDQVDDGLESGRPPAVTPSAAPDPAPAVTTGPPSPPPPPPPPPPPRPHSPLPRVRQIAMILVFDLGGPLLVYSLLRSAGLSAVTALILSGIPPALGIVI